MERRTCLILLMIVSTAAIGAVLAVVLFLADKADSQTPSNLDTLSDADLNVFCARLSHTQSSGAFINMGRLHGDDGYHCPHEKPEFLAWHRAYLIAFENVLGVMMPFWDWTEKVRIRALDNELMPDGARNPLFSSNIFDSAAGGVTGQMSVRNWQPIDADYLSEYVYRALTRPTFAEFQSELEAVHATVHNMIGGTMIPVKTAAFDPIFWLHHSFCNVLWSMWSALHPDADMSGFAAVPLENFDLFGSRSTIGQAMTRTVKFPYNRVYRRAARALGFAIQGDVLAFAASSAHEHDEKEGGGATNSTTSHLIMTLKQFPSTMDSVQVQVTFGSHLVGYLGLIGMAHKHVDGGAAAEMPMAHRDRFIDLTLGYEAHLEAKSLEEVRRVTKVNVRNLISGQETALNPTHWDLVWQTY